MGGLRLRGYSWSGEDSVRLQAIRVSVLGLVAMTAVIQAQTFIEHAAVAGPAAAGSTTGALIGAKLSATFGATAEAASDAEEGATDVKTMPVAVVGVAKGSRFVSRR